MKLHSRRLVTTIAGGVLAFSTLTACGAISSAADCVSVADTMQDVATNVTGDQETLKESTEKLRKDAEGISDEELKQSAIDIADQAEAINAGINGDIAEGAQTDSTKLQDSIDSFTNQCNQFG